MPNFSLLSCLEVSGKFVVGGGGGGGGGEGWGGGPDQV